MPWRWVFESPSCLRGRLEPGLCDPLPAQGRSAAIHAAGLFVSGTLRASYRLTKNMHPQHEHGRGQRHPITLTLRGQGVTPETQENRKVQREGVRSMFSGRVHVGFLNALAEKWTGPGTLQFSCPETSQNGGCDFPAPADRFSTFRSHLQGEMHTVVRRFQPGTCANSA